MSLWLTGLFTTQTPNLEVILFIGFVKSLGKLFALRPLVSRVSQVMNWERKKTNSIFWTGFETALSAHRKTTEVPFTFWFCYCFLLFVLRKNLTI